jgi:predicted lipid carrier protein YhbT
MAETIEEFFQRLDRGHQPLLGKMLGTVRFDLIRGEGEADHWLVAVDHGDVAVSQKKADAECTIRSDKALFEQLIQGEENAMAAVLRGAILCTGDVELLLAIQRIFPGPQKQQQPAGQRG